MLLQENEYLVQSAAESLKDCSLVSRDTSCNASITLHVMGSMVFSMVTQGVKATGKEVASHIEQGQLVPA